MKLVQLRSFIAVVQHGGFTAAARALSISQTTITSQIQALEGEHGVGLSAVGLDLLPIARQISGLESNADLMLHDSGTLKHGSLKIGAVGPFHVMEWTRGRHGVAIGICARRQAAAVADRRRSGQHAYSRVLFARATR